MCVSIFMNVGVCTSAYSMYTLWCQPCPSGLRSPSSCSLRWVTFLGRALGQSSCLVHLSLPPFYLVSSRWAPLSDGTCNYTVTFLIYYCTPTPPSPSTTITTTDPDPNTETLHLRTDAWSEDANAALHSALTLMLKWKCSVNCM